MGASAGGLEAFRKLPIALPADSGMAFVPIQHLDPTHESMMVDLLAGHTLMTVVQSADGMPIERNHVYLMPPRAYLAIRDGALHLSQPRERHGHCHGLLAVRHALCLDRLYRGWATRQDRATAQLD